MEMLDDPDPSCQAFFATQGPVCEQVKRGEERKDGPADDMGEKERNPRAEQQRTLGSCFTWVCLLGYHVPGVDRCSRDSRAHIGLFCG